MAKQEVRTIVQDLEKLKREITCPKCRKPYSQPKLLPCLHSVCAACLVVKEGVREGLRYIVACPECGVEAELSKSGISCLPTAFYKMHLVEICSKLETAEGKKEMGCEGCSLKSAVVSYCSNCKHFICNYCIATHQRMKVLSGHKVMSFDEYKKSLQVSTSLATESESTVMSCKKHGEPLKMYCRTCNVLICRDCTVIDHLQPRHKYDFVQKLIGTQKAELQQTLAVVKKVYSTAASALTEMKSAKEKLLQQKEEMGTSISELFSVLARRLEECKGKLLESSERVVDLKTAQLSDHLTKLEVKTNELEGVIQGCEQGLEHTTDQEFMALKRHMFSRVKEIGLKRQQYAPDAVEPPSLFLPHSCAEEIMNTCLSYAQYHCFLDHSKTTVTGSGVTKVEIGQEAEFTVHMWCGNGRPCFEKQNIRVTVTLPRTGIAVPTSVVPSADLGTYKVTFLPEVRGQYEISVKVSDKEISNSPFYVTAKPSTLEWNGPLRVIPNQEWAWGVTSSANREIYITKNYHHIISILNKDGRQIRTVGLKGQKPGHLWSPTGIALDREGHIYVADGVENGRVQKLSKNGQLVAVFGQMLNPLGVLVNRKNDRVYVCDKGNRRIVILDKNLKLLKCFGEFSRSAGEYEEVTGTLVAPHSLAEDSNGNIFVTDMESGSIQVFNEDGAHLRGISKPQSDNIFAPTGICIEDNLLYVSDCGGNQVVVFQTTGEFVTSFGAFGQLEGQFYTPLSIMVDIDGYLYVCDHCNGRLQVF